MLFNLTIPLAYATKSSHELISYNFQAYKDGGTQSLWMFESVNPLFMGFSSFFASLFLFALTKENQDEIRSF